jgi:protein involved in polysaccharide export with SLBB domain
MSSAKRSLFAVAFIATCALAYPPQEAFSQELEDLVEEAEEEEVELRRIPGVDIPGIGDGRVSGRLRMPKGEEVERLRISQDRKIDPASYIVGPGDAILLYVWGEWDLPYHLEVGPEGSVIIPTVGSFAVADKSLQEVRELLIAAAREQYANVKVTVSLLGMRFFTVYLTGAVLSDGSFIVHPTTRVSELIERGGGFLDDLAGTEIEETVGGKKITRTREFTPQPAARRSIQIFHLDGSRDTVDLEMFSATGEVEHNPYLNMGDVIHVPYLQNEMYAYGSVNQEGVQEFRPGDTIGTLMKLAGGKSGNAPLEEAEVWRFADDGRTNNIIKLVGGEESNFSTLENIAHIALQPKDMLFIRTRSDWQQTPTVHVHGEVGFRGRYRIASGKTKLREVVAMAGGFTADASLAQASVIRAKFRAIVDPELERLLALQEVSGLADMSPQDRAYLKTKGREERGRVAVNFENLFRANDETQNILLEGGDVIFVPQKRRTVSLSGQFSRPGLLDFEEGRRAGFYLEQAGGYSWNADKGGARLIRARTGVRERLKTNLIVEAGDELWVPEKEYRDWWAFAQSTLRTLAETLTLAILVRTI